MAIYTSNDDESFMRRAIELARRGEGLVEPNPMVGCVIVAGGQMAGEGWHRHFGGPHAEVEALRAAGEAARGATAFVSLEPCCHHGKTPPCTEALIAAGIARVVIGTRDPYEKVAGGGIAALRAAGITTTEGVCEDDARRVLAPYLKLVTTGRPWVIAKWAMSLDGKIATRTGESRWISSDASREFVHALRGRVDGILIGRKTAERDDPLLTARPLHSDGIRRTAMRIVLASRATLSPSSQLVQKIEQAPVIVAVSEAAPTSACNGLSSRGVEIVCCAGATFTERLNSLLAELGRRRMTNVLVEGGGEVLGTLLDMRQIDEVHAFVAPKLIGGRDAVTPMEAVGVERIADALGFGDLTVQTLGEDVYIHVARRSRT
jgi:diaminohydroxyphosphoribosylaminopyrimidine deaminase/5-amino-6-(5-phosphoribosylamino)uracil reductase